ncbi:MAG: endolytic transglycosylase MltG [Salinibacterium sp.]|nr:endolytic transglycosylase MltG [Salinibacterium sp.]
MANEPSWEDLFTPKPTNEDSAPEATPEAAPVAAPPSTEQAPASEDPFADLFADATPPAEPVAASAAADRYPPTQAYPEVPADQPMSRRAARESEGKRRGGRGGSSNGGGGSRTGSGAPKKKRSLLWLKITLPIVLVLGAAGGVAAYGWFNYNEQVRALLGIPLPNDFEGTGNGEETIVSIKSGDIGSDVAVTLHEAGVTMTYDAVYNYLVENPDITFTPGNWSLQKQMSAASAVAALQDEANKVTDRLLITEGTVLPNALETIAATTGIPLEEVQAAAADVSSFGLPAEATTLEGFLFPATYELDGTETAHDILQRLVDEMMSRLDKAGVSVDQRWDVVRLASIIQREAGSNIDDFAKISRVFQNRIEQGINLQSDATVAYGTGRLDSVWTEPEERADASNLYNTYANPGLPVGPIGLPGDDAINAALHPADGPWLFFVPINLATGETVFSETADEHQTAVDQLLAWCDASAENATYCQ